MHNRERGAAHINIYFFLVLLVLFLGTLWFGYLQMSEVNGARSAELAARKGQLKAEIKAKYLEDYVEEISNVIGEKGAWTGKSGFNYAERIRTDWQNLYGPDSNPEVPVPPALSSVTVPANAKRVLEDLAKTLGLGETQATPITPFLGQIATLHANQEARVAKALSDLDVAKTATAKLGTDYAANIAQIKAQLTKQNADYTKNTNDLRNAAAQKDQRLASAQSEVRKTNEEKAELVDSHAKVVTGLNKRHDKDQGQLAAYMALNSMRMPPQVADGSVISASMEASIGWIDIGKKDMLLRGTKFRITNPSGEKIKAHGEVISTKQDRAEVRLYDIVDKIGDPVARGDKIYNDLYSPNMKRNVAMIGRFSYPYTKPMIKKLLERLGNKVHDEVKVGVDLVVVGLQEPTESGEALKPIEETPGYKEAQVLRCEIITIQKIRDLLTLGED